VLDVAGRGIADDVDQLDAGAAGVVEFANALPSPSPRCSSVIAGVSVIRA